MSAITNESPATRTPLFARILCVAGPSPQGSEAVRQAVILAGPDATVDLVEPAGVQENVEDYDLIVVSGDGTGLDALSRASKSVLVARAPSSSGGAFPESVLVAVDETAEAYAAAALGAELAVRHSAPVTLVAAPQHDASHQHALQRDVEIVERISGTRPLILDEHRSPVPSILSAAAGIEASMIVLGRRPGAPSPSVSAQVAGAADCSVLVVRAGVRSASED